MLWEHETQLSYESGSNTAAWGNPQPFPEHLEPTEPTSWLTVSSTIFLPNGWPANYPHLIEHVRQAIIQDPAWDFWWSAAGVPECHIFLFLHADDGFGPTGTTVKVGRIRVEANAVHQPAPFTTTVAQELLPRAVSDVMGVLDAVRIKLKLAPLAPLQLSELPPDLPQGMERPETLREILTDTGMRNLFRFVTSEVIGRFRRRGRGTRRASG
jgi:hypothetical protein